MMDHRIIISGMGGQGVLLLGNLLAYSGMQENMNVSVIPSYGAEMRGGISNSFVVFSDAPIGSPVVNNPDSAILMYQYALNKFEQNIKPNGLLIINDNMISLKPSRKDIEIIGIPANAKADELGNLKVVNVILAGVWCKASSCLSYESMTKVIKEIIFANKKKALIDLNLKAFDVGYNYI